MTTEHIFHIEDDWHFDAPIPFAALFHALDQNPHISQICLRNLDDFLSSQHLSAAQPVAQATLPLYQLTGLHDQWFGYTFNPHVTTSRLVKSLTPFSAYRKERHISRRIRQNGLYTAFLNPGGCTHLGELHSVTAEVEAKQKGLLASCMQRLQTAFGVKE